MSSILKVDTIDEVTSANGVTVDGLSIKDSKLVTANSVVETNLTNDIVTLAKMAPGTDGNIISYDASGNPVAVATGSAGQVLTSAGAGAPPTFAAAASGANTPAWKVSGNNTSCANATATKLTINTEQLDTDNKVTSDKVTPGEGKFQINIKIHSTFNNDTDVFQIRFYKNGGFHQGSQMINRESNDAVMSLIIISNSTDYWEVFCQQQTGGTVNIALTEFSGFKLIGV